MNSAFEEADTPAAEVMMKRMGESDGLVFDGFPTCVKAANVIRKVSGKKAVLLALYGLFKPFAMVNGLPWLLAEG